MSVFQRSGDLKEFLRRTPITSLLVIINTVMLLVVVYFDIRAGRLGATGFSAQTLAELGGLVPVFVKNGEYYRVFTHAFLHGSLLHYLLNVFMGLFIISSAFERLQGKWRFIIVYVVAILISGAMITVLGDDWTVSIGASGGIYGILGAFLYIVINFPHLLHERDRSMITGLLVINIVFTLLVPSVSILGHLGGLAGGFLVSFIVVHDPTFKVMH